MNPAYMPSARPPANQKHMLRKREKQVLTDMIRMAVPMSANGMPVEPTISPENDAPADMWRLLIFDDTGRDIIAPLLKVGDLRELGVTLYMHIKTERDAVPGAPAIYLCAPTEENIQKIVKDCASELYEWVYINFTEQVPRSLLEFFAHQLAATRLASIHNIRVFDRTLRYVALDEDLFSLMLPQSFVTLNRRDANDAEIEAHLRAVVLGISHVLLSLQVLPVIVHSNTGAAEEVARRLAATLSDALQERQLTPAPSALFGRPLLLLVDRASDLATALHHPFSYRGLLVDVAGMRLNKCHIQTPEGKDEVFEIDPERDSFYAQNASEDFSAVGSNIEGALRQYKEEYAKLAEESTVGTEDDSDANAMSKLLASAPMLAERKRFLDAHTKLAFSFLSMIRRNHLDHFHGVELGVLRREGLDKEEFAKLLAGCGTAEDRQRLYLIGYLMCTEDDEEAFVRKQLQHFEDQTFPALEYLKHLRSWSLTPQSPSGAAAQASNAGEGFGWGFAQQIAKNIASSLATTTETELPLTKLVDALLQDPPNVAAGGGGNVGGGGGGMGGGNSLRNKLLETVSAYDPRTKKAVDLKTTCFAQAMVFALGGGCVAEYDDLKRWEAARPRKAVSYGCTAVTSGDEVLQQLTFLGNEMKS